MRVTWYGHAAFAVEGKNAGGEARKVILDPYNYPACGGYLPVNDSADVVCVSHFNPTYHSDTSSIEGDYVLLEALEVTGGSREVQGIRFDAFEVHENDHGEGPNAMVKFELDRITVAHQGDLGHALEGAALDFLRGVDVLLALAGGPPTIDLDDLLNVVEETAPRLVIPMHYKTAKVNLDILTIDHFLRLCGGHDIKRSSTTSVNLTPDDLPPATRILVLDHAR